MGKERRIPERHRTGPKEDFLEIFGVQSGLDVCLPQAGFRSERLFASDSTLATLSSRVVATDTQIGHQWQLSLNGAIYDTPFVMHPDFFSLLDPSITDSGEKRKIIAEYSQAAAAIDLLASGPYGPSSFISSRMVLVKKLADIYLGTSFKDNFQNSVQMTMGDAAKVLGGLTDFVQGNSKALSEMGLPPEFVADELSNYYFLEKSLEDWDVPAIAWSISQDSRDLSVVLASKAADLMIGEIPESASITAFHNLIASNLEYPPNELNEADIFRRSEFSNVLGIYKDVNLFYMFPRVYQYVNHVLAIKTGEPDPYERTMNASHLESWDNFGLESLSQILQDESFPGERLLIERSGKTIAGVAKKAVLPIADRLYRVWVDNPQVQIPLFNNMNEIASGLTGLETLMSLPREQIDSELLGIIEQVGRSIVDAEDTRARIYANEHDFDWIAGEMLRRRVTGRVKFQQDVYVGGSKLSGAPKPGIGNFQNSTSPHAFFMRSFRMANRFARNMGDDVVVFAAISHSTTVRSNGLQTNYQVQLAPRDLSVIESNWKSRRFYQFE